MSAPQALDDQGEQSAVRIDIYGEIGWEVSGSEFLRDLRALGDIAEINLRIHSPGGSVLDGWAVANGLMAHPAKVNARVEGMAASMASVITMAADHVEMPENAYQMIHNVSAGAWGEAEELEKTLRLMKALQADVVNFYAKRTGLEAEAIEKMMAEETWMNGPEALALGFAHEVLEPVAVAAVADVTDLAGRFERAPAELVAIAPAEEVDETVETEETEAGETAEAETEETVENTETEESEEEAEETPAPASRLRKFLSAMAGDRKAGGAAENLQAALATNATLRAEVVTLTARAESAEVARDLAAARVAELEEQERDLDAVLSESGFSPADSADLPAPTDDNPLSEKERVEAEYKELPAGKARAEFRAKNKEILG